MCITSSTRHSEWNKRMLQNIFHLVDKELVVNNDDATVEVIIGNLDNGSNDKKLWKKLLMTTIDVMSKVDAKVIIFVFF